MDSLVSGASAAFPQGPCAVDEFSNIIFDSGPPAPSSLTDADCTEDEFLLLTNPDDFTSDFHDVDVTEAAAPEADIAPGTAAAAAPTAGSPPPSPSRATVVCPACGGRYYKNTFRRHKEEGCSALTTGAPPRPRRRSLPLRRRRARGPPPKIPERSLRVRVFGVQQAVPLRENVRGAHPIMPPPNSRPAVPAAAAAPIYFVQGDKKERPG